MNHSGQISVEEFPFLHIFLHIYFVTYTVVMTPQLRPFSSCSTQGVQHTLVLEISQT